MSYPSKLPESFAMVTARTPSYWIYAPGEQQIDDAGNFKYSEETIVDYVEQEGFKTVEKKIRLTSTYDTAKEIYVVTLPSDAFKETDTVRLKVSDDGSGKYSIKQAYIDQSFFACQLAAGGGFLYSKCNTYTAGHRSAVAGWKYKNRTCRGDGTSYYAEDKGRERYSC